MGRDRYARQSLGSLHSRVKESRVLMVGAGGIGCELLKNIVLIGFGEIHIVDLDTIDLSNLNRQFLFRYEHIKKSKALVAKESAGRFNPNVKIEAHHANIKDPQFNIAWFKSFTLVFNALDNVDARRHVNKMCIAADVPLVESGTTGFDGQAQIIKKGVTECYDCNVKETPKSFPVCTIRSTPSQPIHCIVWAKSYLFTEIFGTSEDEAPELDHAEDSENAQEIENLRQEAQALKKIRGSMGSEDFPKTVFEKVFKEDIDRLRSMEDMWKIRSPPEPLDFEALSQEALGVSSDVAQQDQAVWTVTENLAVFCDSLRRLSVRMKEMKANANASDAPPILTFDKDDVDTLDFVAASANLRSTIFDIQTRSKFDIKQMAGNIIPAIATTNAIIAGLCVLEAFKVMRGEYSKAPMTFLTTSTDRVISAERTMRPPNPECVVCGVARTSITVDTSRATLSNLVDLLREDLGYSDELSVSTDALLYDPDFDDNLSKTFGDLGIKDDAFVTITDEDENPRVNLVLSISEQSLPEDSKSIVLPGKIEIGRKPKDAAPDAQSNGAVITNGVNGHADGVTGKRKRSADETAIEDERIRKRGKVPEQATRPADDDIVILDDAHGGAILIDDD